MAAPYTAPTMHILLLEDDRTLAAAVLAYLHTKHYQVDWADSLAQARALIGVNHYWAVLLDLNLPDGDGLTLLPQLRTAPDRPTVIAVTARDQAKRSATPGPRTGPFLSALRSPAPTRRTEAPPSPRP